MVVSFLLIKAYRQAAEGLGLVQRAAGGVSQMNSSFAHCHAHRTIVVLQEKAMFCLCLTSLTFTISGVMRFGTSGPTEEG